MKKKIALPIIIALFSSSLLLGCNKSEASNRISFDKSEYVVKSGDYVTVKENTKDVTYSFVHDYDKLNVETNTGKITFSDDLNNTQVLYVAKKGNYVTDPVVLTLSGNVVIPEIDFVETTDYICDNNYIYATSSTNSSIFYKLENAPSGISINASSGLVRLSESVSDGVTFDVVISSNGATKRKTFTAIKSNLAKSLDAKQVTEKDNIIPVSFNIDFSDVPMTYERKVTRLISGHTILGSDTYSYDEGKNRLNISVDALQSLNVGENTFTIVTTRNMIDVTVILASKIVKTPSDLASIGTDVDTLSGYYVLGNDIDLTSYLAKGGEGYNDGKGWTPIGIYHDVLDGTALRDTFKGTFDGNGYTVSGFYMNRTDEFGFNAGLFGYVFNIAVIKNLTLVGDPRGTSVASFSGAIAGFNEGTITNCIANVNVSNDHGGDSYHIVGGFVGRNTGTIDHCIALGSVAGEAEIGAFVGVNEGEIRNCYSSKESYSVFNTGLEAIDSHLYETIAELNADKHNLDLEETYWDLDGANISLKHSIKFYFPYNLVIANEESDYTLGDVIDLDVRVYPEYLYDELKDQIVITSNDENAHINNFKIDTKDLVINDLKVDVSLTLQGITMKASKVFRVYAKVETLSIDNTFTNSKVEVGKSYKLHANIAPAGALQEAKWSLSASSMIIGIEVEGDVLTIDETVERFAQDTFQIIAKAGGLSDALTLTINRPKSLGIPTQTLYSNDIHDLSYLFPDEVNLNNAKLYKNEQEINYTLNGHVITISSDLVTGTTNTDILFKLVLENGDYYRLYANYLPHEKYIVSALPEDAIAISSKEDFAKYFNIYDLDDPTRYKKYYNKTFYLTSDIDFNNDAIFSIGYDDETTGVSRPFTGKLYGFGHTIKNANITDSEKYLTLTSSQRADNYRSSKYGVGFFGAFNGEVYDVIFDNINVNTNSWCGTFAGTMEANSKIENIHFINSSVRNGDGNYYSSGALRTGKFTALNNGLITACSYNGSIFGLVG